MDIEMVTRSLPECLRGMIICEYVNFFGRMLKDGYVFQSLFFFHVFHRISRLRGQAG